MGSVYGDLVLASLVRTMRAHYLAVRCGCGTGRVIALEAMARDRRTAGLKLAHVALKLACEGCHTGPDEVHLTATLFGLGRCLGRSGAWCGRCPLWSARW